jgi:hypothetical protein
MTYKNLNQPRYCDPSTTYAKFLRGPRRFFRPGCKPVRADIMWPTVTQPVKEFESVMLSAAKHLCSSSQSLESKATAGILRFAQDDTELILSHVLTPWAIPPCGTARYAG